MNFMCLNRKIVFYFFLLSIFITCKATLSSAFSKEVAGTIWNMNGAEVRLRSDGSYLLMTYERPPQNPSSEGQPPETVSRIINILFMGMQRGQQIEGYARWYKAGCEPVEYFVRGKLQTQKSGKLITLKGMPPTFLDNSCMVKDSKDSSERSADYSLDLTYLRSAEEPTDLIEDGFRMVHRSKRTIEGVGVVTVEGLASEMFGAVNRWTGINVRLQCPSGRVMTLLDIDKVYENRSKNTACDIEKVTETNRILRIYKKVYDPGGSGCVSRRGRVKNEEEQVSFDLTHACHHK